MSAGCTNAIWIILAGLLMSSLTITFHPGLAQENITNSPSVPSLTYSNSTSFDVSTIIPDIKAVVQFPAGWSGFANTAAPGAVNSYGVPQSTDPLDNVTMIVLGGNTTNFGRLFGLNGSNAISFGDAMSKGQKNDECKSMTGLTDTFIHISSIEGEKVVWQCGTQGGTKYVAYVFASNNKNIIMPYFSGSTLAVDHHLPKIEESIQKIQIEKPTSVKELITVIGKSD